MFLTFKYHRFMMFLNDVRIPVQWFSHLYSLHWWLQYLPKLVSSNTIAFIINELLHSCILLSSLWPICHLLKHTKHNVLLSSLSSLFRGNIALLGRDLVYVEHTNRFVSSSCFRRECLILLAHLFNKCLKGHSKFAHILSWHLLHLNPKMIHGSMTKLVIFDVQDVKRFKIQSERA